MKTRSVIVALVLATGTAFAEKKIDDKATEPAAAATAEVKAGTAVENHEVVGEASTFPAGTTVWVWSRIKGGEGTVKHVWKRDGKDVWTGTLPVKSSRWSTQTRRKISTKGAWTVDVQTDAGTSIGTVGFTIE